MGPIYKKRPTFRPKSNVPTFTLAPNAATAGPIDLVSEAKFTGFDQPAPQTQGTLDFSFPPPLTVSASTPAAISTPPLPSAFNFSASTPATISTPPRLSAFNFAFPTPQTISVGTLAAISAPPPQSAFNFAAPPPQSAPPIQSSFNFTFPPLQSTPTSASAPLPAPPTETAANLPLPILQPAPVSYAQYEALENKVEGFSKQLEKMQEELQGCNEAIQSAKELVEQLRYELKCKTQECEDEVKAKKEIAAQLVNAAHRLDVMRGCHKQEREAREKAEEKLGDAERLLAYKDEAFKECQQELKDVAAAKNRDQYNEGRRDGEERMKNQMNQGKVRHLEKEIRRLEADKVALATEVAELKKEARLSLMAAVDDGKKNVALVEKELGDFQQKMNSAAAENNISQQKLISEKNDAVAQMMEAQLSVATSTAALAELQEKYNKLLKEKFISVETVSVPVVKTVDVVPPPVTIDHSAWLLPLLALMGFMFVAAFVFSLLLSVPVGGGAFGYGAFVGDNAVTRIHAELFGALVGSSGGVKVYV